MYGVWRQVVSELTLPGGSSPPLPFSQLLGSSQELKILEIPLACRGGHNGSLRRGATPVTKRKGKVSLSFKLSPFEIGKGDSGLGEILLERDIAGARGNRKNALTVRYARVSKVKQKGFSFY